jgi:NhaP-type Na+/H+ or K+/H+ antiporter
LVTQPSIPKALGTWFWKAWLFNIFMAIIVGLCIGIAFRHAFLAAEKAEWIDKTSLLASSVALSLFITGLFSFIQSDDSLCCFMCGYAFTWHPRFRKAAYKERFQEVIEMIINFSFFVILGNVLPWDRWMEIGYGTLVLLSIAVLLFKRLPMMMLLKPWTPVLKTNLEAVFAGWFGPVGVGAISFAL